MRRLTYLSRRGCARQGCTNTYSLAQPRPCGKFHRGTLVVSLDARRIRRQASTSAADPGLRIVLNRHAGPNESVRVDTHFRVEVDDTAVSGKALRPHALVCETLALSVDPYMRCRFFPDSGVDYVESFEVNKPITSAGVGCVTAVGEALAKAGRFAPGDLVVEASFHWPWQRVTEFDLAPASQGGQGDSLMLQRLPPMLPLIALPTATLGALGQTGLTAYFGVERMAAASINPGDTVVVSSAAGAVGSVAAQLAKRRGARVIGLTGSDNKARVIEQTAGCDVGLNYKAENFTDALAAAAGSDGVAVYWDNVGGAVTEAVIECMAPGSLIVLCGQIADYDKTHEYPPPLPAAAAATVAARGIRRDRYLVLQYQDELEAGLAELVALVASGDVNSLETVEHGLELAPVAFEGVMRGRNVGKQVVMVGEWPRRVEVLRAIGSMIPGPVLGSLVRKFMS